jgi:hypothetical protein
MNIIEQQSIAGNFLVMNLNAVKITVVKYKEAFLLTDLFDAENLIGTYKKKRTA